MTARASDLYWYCHVLVTKSASIQEAVDLIKGRDGDDILRMVSGKVVEECFRALFKSPILLVCQIEHYVDTCFDVVVQTTHGEVCAADQQTGRVGTPRQVELWVVEHAVSSGVYSEQTYTGNQEPTKALL